MVHSSLYFAISPSASHRDLVRPTDIDENLSLVLISGFDNKSAEIHVQMVDARDTVSENCA